MSNLPKGKEKQPPAPQSQLRFRDVSTDPTVMVNPDLVLQRVSDPLLFQLNTDGISQPQDMYVGTRGRDPFPTPFMPINDDPMKKQCGGGCPKDDDLNKDIYWDLFAQEVAKTPTVNLQDRAQRKEVHMRVVDTMRPQVRENRKYEKQDKEGPPESDGPDFEIRDGHIYYRKFGKSLDQMYEDQKRLRRWQYDEKEHHTMRLVEKKLVEAEQRGTEIKVSHVSHNKDKQGNVAIRDEITLVWDPETNTGRMELHNIAQGGKYLSMEEAREVMRHRAPHAEEISETEEIFIFTEERQPIEELPQITETPYLTERLIQEVVSAAKDYPSKDASVGRDTGDYTEPRERVTDRVVTDTIRTAEYVGRSLQLEFQVLGDKASEHIVIPPFLQRLLGISVDKYDRKETGEVETYEELVHSIVLEDSKDSVGVAREMRATEAAAMEILATVMDPETQGVAIPAAIFALDVLAHPEMMIEEKIQEGAESIPLTEKEQEVINAFLIGDEMPQLVDRQGSTREFVFTQLASMQEKQVEGVSSGLEQVDLTVLSWMRDLIQRIDGEPVEEAVEKVEVEEKEKLTQMKTLWEVLTHVRELKFAITPTPDRTSEVHFASRTEVRYYNNEQEHVENFSFAIMIWLLLKLDNYYRSLRSLKTLIFGETKQGSLIEKLKEHMPEGLVQRESAPWILFAIIWHLAMIREQGMIQATGNKRQATGKNKTKNKFQNNCIPPGGVIFAFAS